MSEFKDKAGVPLAPGDYVAYAESYGRSPGLSYGKVLGVSPNGRLRVWGVDVNSWGGTEKASPNTRASVLSYSERVVLSTCDQVHPLALEALDKIEVKEGDINEES